MKTKSSSDLSDNDKKGLSMTKPLSEIARDMDLPQEERDLCADLDRRWEILEPFDQFLAVDPRVTVADVLLAAYMTDVPMTIARRATPEQSEAIKAELRRGLAVGEWYGKIRDDQDVLDDEDQDF